MQSINHIKKTSVCPRNCYSTCSLNLFMNVDTGRVDRVEAHPANLATPHGPCLKGLSYVERQYSRDRILTPLRRKQGGGFTEITWSEAVVEISNRLNQIKQEWGPQSVFYYSASGTKGLLNSVGSSFWRLFGGYTTTYGDLCWPAGLEATRLTLGSNKHNVPWDIVHSDLIILWGKNAAETNVQQMNLIDQARSKGAKLVVIDTRRTITADKADFFIQPKPGTDGALALGICRELILKGSIDTDFIEDNILGFESFRESLGGFDVGETSKICDIPKEKVKQLADWIGEHQRVTLCPGFGMQRYTNSGQTMRAMLAILAITGNIGKKGAGWQYANLQSDIFSKTQNPMAFFPPETLRKIVGSEVPSHGMARVSVSTARLGRDMLFQSDPPLKFAWIERGNPVTQNPETHQVLKAFSQLDFRVVVEQFMTDTAMEADIILPAKTLFEQSDLIGAYWHPYIQLKQKVVEPPPQVKPETEIYRLLAQELGFIDQMNAFLPAPGDQGIDEFLTEKLKPFPELSLEKLKKGPQLAPGYQEIAYVDMIFDTPSGKIEIASENAELIWNQSVLPEYVPISEIDALSQPKNAPYPLFMMTPNTKNRIHSQFSNLDLIRAVSSEPEITLAAPDALERGIQSGDMVRVFNERGELTLKSNIDFSLKKGCVSITNGFWIQNGGTVNFLSKGLETDMGHGAAFHNNLVQVEKP